MKQILIADKILIGKELVKNKAVIINEGKIIDVIDAFESEITHIPAKTFPSGSILMPAFIDTHTHLASYGLSLTKPNLNNFESKKDVIDYSKEYIKNFERDIYIFLGYDESKWTDENEITKEDLDKISKEKPIIFRRICGHKAVLNSKALEIVKNIQGVDFKTGIALEYLPLNIYEIFKPTIEEIKDGILKAQEIAINLGIKSIIDITNIESFKAYQELKREG